MNGPQTGGTTEAQVYSNPVLARYEPVIGLEVHCQLKTRSKLFCGCSTEFGALPNHHTCPICLGYPGVLPVINQGAVDFAIRFALAVGAEVREKSVFARKQYFYPDLPKGYQITQFDLPYCSGGKIKLSSSKEIKLTRAHLEEDAGKNIHGEGSSYVDLNRAGVALIEIVSEPEIASPEEAADYLKKLRSIVRYLEICDGNLEEGSFRCDANVSIRPRGQTKFGTRAEIKNLNSFKNIERAISYEIIRQADLLDNGHKVVQQTMQFDPASGKTKAMRSKEQAHDYRYFPDPDLKPLVITNARVAAVKASLPELPEQFAKRFQLQYGLNDYDSAVLTLEKELATFYEDVVKRVGDVVSHKIVANWVLSEYLREVNNRGWNLSDPKITAEMLAELLELIGKDTISGKIAKTVFEEMVETGKRAGAIVKEKGLVQVSDVGAIEKIVEQVLNDSQGQIDEYFSGREKVYGYFVGQVMKLSGGKLNPGLVNKVLKEKLDARKAK
jgi:aspartyl-tRNA(Asn)/glutamyl-tRNA(Gln) amidotransferase subunit B